MSKTRNILHNNDIRFVEFASGLSAAEWGTPSLCGEWSNHDVLAHLVIGYRASLRMLAADLVSQRGSFDRANAALAIDLARRHNPDELIAEFAELAVHPRGIGQVFPRRLLLGDHVIHELDIAFALDRTPTVGIDALVAVLNTQVRVPNPFVPVAQRARGLSLRAHDVDWTSGEGDWAVTGGAAQLASALAGRPWALDQLSGKGVDTLRTRMLLH
ncbi:MULTISPECIES: maleylpyruvate isomerase family mycothiol-dependent enzyme [Mycobacterium]|uniref:Mycothiol-dependent maleylpyruvate isomerase metal-binding domain-containing protein n=1 Tax=Mycobacterium pseudoshottsii TaxID=265949 RepID=A0A9N7QP20_9MYCO|nr:MULTISPECIES: maleylpyruvate isomerase family mycothiol-dependent enzyme [Mycobacterium]EPQ46769.1 hypothetical protein MMSP_2530 [Mycobacterium sp. 012931]BDN83465.1 hypothetical protein NJB1907Z4_C36800 [Mycobacterium pseudoshottsii]BEH77849.1 hypothetical protein YM3MPS_36520 [Mycobacterium pseudoshottsii]